MKKIATFIVCLFTASLACAQTVNVETTGDRAYNEGDKIFQVGIGFGYYGYGYLGSRSIGVPPITAALELGLHEYISVGPYAGYSSWNYKYTGGDYGWNFLAVGARGSFHYLPLLNEALDFGLDEEKLDFYVSLLLGVELQTFRGDDIFGNNNTYANNTDFIFGPVLGFRYKFNDGFGAYFEGGRGALSVASLGVSFHF